MTRILIIDDELSIRNVLRLSLASHGYSIEEAATAQEGLEKVAKFHPHLLILDLGLPDMTGFEVLREIRGWSSVPIIVLTVTDDEATKVKLLETGADDYITKPFSTPELIARVKVALRHHQFEEATPTFNSDDLRVDLTKREVFVSGHLVKLTMTEYELLRILVRDCGQVVPQEKILTEVWGPHAVDNPHYLRIYIGHLRKKLEANASQPKHIITEPGIGYRIQ